MEVKKDVSVGLLGCIAVWTFSEISFTEIVPY
jgi:hypothetical protein